MPPRTPRLQFPGHLVTAVLVSHDGARWLPESLSALLGQLRPPQRIVAVDTGSCDGSVDVLRDALGESALLTMPRDTPLGNAVHAGLEAFNGAPAPRGLAGPTREWLWLLHDDCAPEPSALAELLDRAEQSPSARVIGPKVVSWDRRRLLEVGVTVDSSGRRETGLEPREVDQGQHDDVGDVLAVGTAGMLISRDTWESLGGLDPRLPLFGDDVDLGWRVNAAGGRVLVAPRAIVRHAAALSTGGRTAGAVTGSRRAAARHHGMQVVLANTSRMLVPFLILRFLVESVLRSLAALVLLRDPAHAVAELVALGRLVRHPLAVVSARRLRQPTRQVSYSELRPLLAPAGLRWRRLATAVTGTVRRRADDARDRVHGPVETGPVAEEAESFAVDDAGVLRRALRRPGVVLALALTALGLVADRHLLGGSLHGGRLLPAPDGARDLWSAYVSGWHPAGLGSTAASPPYLALIALLSTVLLGKVWLATSVLLLGGVPLAGLSAYLASAGLVRSWRLRIWAAVLYALVPAVTGAIAGGRVEVVAAVIILPLVARACAAALRIDTGKRGWHRSIGAGLLLAVATACAPVLWLIAVPVLAAAALMGSDGGGRARRLAAAGALVAVAPVVLLPWTWHVATHPSLLVAGAGLPDQFAGRRPVSVADLLLLRPGGSGQPPLWVWAPIVAAALGGVMRAGGRLLARVGFLAFLAGVAAALAVSRLDGASPGVEAARFWTGPALAVAALGALMAALAAADGLQDALRRHSFGWRQSTAVLLTVATVAATLTIAVGWVSRGAGRPLAGGDAGLLPIFAAAEASRPTSPRVLALRSQGGVVHYALIRTADGPRLGDADVDDPPSTHAARVAADRLAEAVRDGAAGRAQAAGELAEFGVTLIVIPEDSAQALSRFAAVAGLSQVPAASTTVLRTSVPTGEVVILPPDAARATSAGGPLSASARPVPVVAGLGHTKATVPSGQAGRLLVLAEPASGQWRASVDGKRLPRARAYGWAQAWTLPAEGGHLVIGRADVGWLRWPSLQLALLLAAAFLAIPNRRLAQRAVLADERAAA